MTVVEPDGVTDGAGSALERDLAQLREALTGHRFPTQQDDLIAACLGRQAPARLCSRLSTLSRTTVYFSIDEVLDAVLAAHA